MKYISDILSFLGTNKIVLGICSLLGIIGFCITTFIALRTRRIERVLRYNSIMDQYNKDRGAFQKTFEGHIASILDDKIFSDRILKNILRNVEAYRTKFKDILSFSEKIELYRFCRLLRKRSADVDPNEVCNYLATMSGHLSKKGDKKNG